MSAFISPLIQYGVFFILLTIALREVSVALWSESERVNFRDRFIRTVKVQQLKLRESREDSGIDRLLREAEVPWLTAARLIWIQLFILVIGVTYSLLVVNWISAILFASSFYIVSQPTLKYSPFRLYLNRRVKNVRLKKEFELFTLFDLLKAELVTSSEGQVNVYHLLSESLPYFKSINYSIIRFLSLWRRSPTEAGKVFVEDLGGETAEFLGDVLSKMHNLSRKDALHLLVEQNDLFRFRISEMAMRKAEVQRNIYYILFFCSSVLSMVWFIYYIFSLSIKSLNM